MLGRVIGGSYRVGALLSQGAMGDVYEASDPSGELVALKFLRFGASHPDLAARFRREARIAARIVSPHVARVLGAGKDRDGTLWIAFERLVGESLQERLAKAKTLPLAEVAWIVAHALEGLAAAHAAGVVHRDIKPANIFLERAARRAKIIDFGISKLREPSIETESPGLTEDDTTLGTLRFMAPEQIAAAANVDARADLYAIGVVAFVGLAGLFPFRGEGVAAVLHHKRYFEALSLREATGASWPTALEQFLGRALARDPQGRFDSAEAAIAAWRQVGAL